VKYYYDTFLAPALSDQQLERLISVQGWENLRAALDRGKGVVMVTAHLGSPSLVVQIVGARKCRMTIVVEPIRPPSLFELMARVRAGREGLRIVSLGPSVTRELTEALRRNEIVGLVADRDIARNGVSVQFFGRETLVPVGPVMLALRTGAALMTAFTRRLDDGSLVGRVDEPLELERTGNLREELRLNTQKLAWAMEEAIRRSPEQWTVFEPIWPEGGSGTHLGAAV
jgi:KDO2-lipid IV(A) lauroyltransferase